MFLGRETVFIRYFFTAIWLLSIHKFSSQVAAAKEQKGCAKHESYQLYARIAFNYTAILLWVASGRRRRRRIKTSEFNLIKFRYKIYFISRQIYNALNCCLMRAAAAVIRIFIYALSLCSLAQHTERKLWHDEKFKSPMRLWVSAAAASTQHLNYISTRISAN